MRSGTDIKTCLAAANRPADSRRPRHGETHPPRRHIRIDADEVATVRGLAPTPDDGLRAAVIERLMCDLWVDVATQLRRRSFPNGWLDAELASLASLVADGLGRVEEDVVTVPEFARNLARRVASAFDAYLDPAAGATPSLCDTKRR